jgi:restriction system protein
MPPARRRDFNLILVKDGVKSIGECKCFSQSHHIGRPVLQKLIGANATQYAQEMLVITTSSFTADAKKFGAESNIELIGGDRLVRMCQTVWGDHPTAQAIPSESIELSHQEQLANIPSDMRDLYR